MKRILFGVLLVIASTGCIARLHSTSAGPVTPAQMAELWEEPSDLGSRDLFHGPWPKDFAPNPTAAYTFVSAKTVGVSPGFTVTDEQGVQWSVKLGREVKVEVVTSRILTALGYHQPPVYYLPKWTLKGGPGPSAQPEARFRPKHAVLKDSGEWSWQENPFIGSRPYNGLRVLMMLLNQSDLKNSNNTLYEVTKAEVAGSTARRWYVARDIGAGLGETGRVNPKRDDPALFEEIAFMKGVDDGDVHFNYHGRHQELADHISPADVRWMCAMLSQLSNERWHDAFRAAGYEKPIADRYIARIKAKIAEGQSLAD
jgi:hypothetical protein